MIYKFSRRLRPQHRTPQALPAPAGTPPAGRRGRGRALRRAQSRHQTTRSRVKSIFSSRPFLREKEIFFPLQMEMKFRFEHRIRNMLFLFMYSREVT